MTTIKEFAEQNGYLSCAATQVRNNDEKLHGFAIFAGVSILALAITCIALSQFPGTADARSVLGGLYGTTAGIGILGTCISGYMRYRQNHRQLSVREETEMQEQETTHAQAQLRALETAQKMQFNPGTMTRDSMMQEIGEDAFLAREKGQLASIMRESLIFMVLSFIAVIALARILPDKTSDDLLGRKIALGSLGSLAGLAGLTLLISGGFMYRFKHQKISQEVFEQCKTVEKEYFMNAGKHLSRVNRAADTARLMRNKDEVNESL